MVKLIAAHVREDNETENIEQPGGVRRHVCKCCVCGVVLLPHATTSHVSLTCFLG